MNLLLHLYIGEEFYTIPQLCRARIPQVEEIKELDTNWEPNTHYTFTLNLTETKLTHTTGISTGITEIKFSTGFDKF